MSACKVAAGVVQLGVIGRACRALAAATDAHPNDRRGLDDGLLDKGQPVELREDQILPTARQRVDGLEERL